MFNMTKEEACVTDILIDLSEPKVSPKKHDTITSRKFQTSTKENNNSQKLSKQNCAIGILIDFSDAISQPLGEKNRTDDHQSISPDYSEMSGIGNLSLSKLLDLEGPYFEISSQLTEVDGEVNDQLESCFSRLKKAKDSHQAHSPLNAHQMAEIFEQANTIAVRIELANAKQRRQRSTDNSRATVSIDGSGGEESVVVDEHAKPVTSTPANEAATDVSAHFWEAEFEKSVCLELEEKASSPAERPVVKKQIRIGERTASTKQFLTDTSKGKSLIGRAPSQRTVTAGTLATPLLSRKPTTDSTYNYRKSTASSTASDSKVPQNASKSKVSIMPPCGSTQQKQNADPKTSEVLTRSQETPSVPAGRPGMRNPVTSKAGSLEMAEKTTKALALKPPRSLPQKPPGKLEKKEAGGEHGANPSRVPAVTKLQRKHSIPRKAGNQTTAPAAGKPRN